MYFMFPNIKFSRAGAGTMKLWIDVGGRPVPCKDLPNGCLEIPIKVRHAGCDTDVKCA